MSKKSARSKQDTSKSMKSSGEGKQNSLNTGSETSDNAFRKKVIRTHHSQVERVQVIFPDDGLTKQSFRDECNINHIISRYRKTGSITHVKPNFQWQAGVQPTYDYLQTQTAIAEAKSIYEGMPLDQREKFDGVQDFLEACVTDDRYGELVAAGVAEALPEVSVPDPEEIPLPPGDQTEETEE